MADEKTRIPTGINNLLPDGCGYGKVNREKIENLGETFKRFVDNDFKEVRDDVKCIRDKVMRFVSPRTVIVITITVSTITALVVALIKVV